MSAELDFPKTGIYHSTYCFEWKICYLILNVWRLNLILATTPHPEKNMSSVASATTSQQQFFQAAQVAPKTDPTKTGVAAPANLAAQQTITPGAKPIVESCRNQER